MRVGLIACCKSKAAKPSLALSLYQGALFRKSVVWAKRNCDAWAILSAKYGLVLPTDKIAPYEQTLSAMTPVERHQWAQRTGQQIERVFPNAKLVYLAGALYCAGLPPGERPLGRMPFGQRLQWLDRQNVGRPLL